MAEHRFKVAVVGDAFVGKSCLLYRLRFGRMPGKNYANTIGCEFLSHAVETEAGKAVLCIWDTAGHETFRTFTSNFLRNAQACILCADLSNALSVANLHWWAEEARRHDAGVSLVLVGTKADLPRALPEEALRDWAGSLAAVMHGETSASTGEGVGSLFRDIATHLVAKHPDPLEHRPSAIVSLGSNVQRRGQSCPYGCCHM